MQRMQQPCDCGNVIGAEGRGEVKYASRTIAGGHDNRAVEGDVEGVVRGGVVYEDGAVDLDVGPRVRRSGVGEQCFGQGQAQLGISAGGTDCVVCTVKGYRVLFSCEVVQFNFTASREV